MLQPAAEPTFLLKNRSPTDENTGSENSNDDASDSASDTQPVPYGIFDAADEEPHANRRAGLLDSDDNSDTKEGETKRRAATTDSASEIQSEEESEGDHTSYSNKRGETESIPTVNPRPRRVARSSFTSNNVSVTPDGHSINVYARSRDTTPTDNNRNHQEQLARTGGKDITNTTVQLKPQRVVRSSLARSGEVNQPARVKEAHLVNIVALTKVGIMFAYVSDAKDPMKPAYIGNFSYDLQANFEGYADKLRVHSVMTRRNPTDPTTYHEYRINTKNGPTTISQSLFFHIAEKESDLENPMKRLGFGRNIAAVLNNYATIKFRYPAYYEMGSDMTLMGNTDNAVLSDYLTLRDTRDMLAGNVFQGYTKEAIAGNEELMQAYFGQRNWEFARKFFLQGITGEGKAPQLEQW